MFALHSTAIKAGGSFSRREFIRIGGLAAGGLTLADVLRAEAEQGKARPFKAVIHIHLAGGPPHQDLFDLKPSAPAEIRGEFRPIASNVPGMDMCELLPNLAACADKFAVVRSLVGCVDGHHAHGVLTGYPPEDLQPLGGRPSFGAITNKLLGPGPGGAPGWVSDHEKGARYRDPVGFLGPTCKPYSLSDGGGAASLELLDGLTVDRLARRTDLRTKLNTFRREADHSGQMEAFDGYTRTAVEIVTSGRVAEALDLSKEDPAVIERYTGGQPLYMNRGDADLRVLILARRLIQAGVRIVTLRNPFGGLDTHADNFKTMRAIGPRIDRGLAALVWDLERLGLSDDVLVVAMGEFGRTPRINKDAGRDHWPRVNCAFVSGAGWKMGQYVGGTDRLAGEASENPIHQHRLLAMLYRHLGFDTDRTTLTDPAGRPQYFVEHRDPIRELLG